MEKFGIIDMIDRIEFAKRTVKTKEYYCIYCNKICSKANRIRHNRTKFHNSYRVEAFHSVYYDLKRATNKDIAELYSNYADEIKEFYGW